MRLSPDEAIQRLRAHDHGVLATVHPERGVDAVPVVFAVVDDVLGIPVDRVKPKSAGRLQRERNLEADPRATLLIDEWDPADWSRLWWVRAELRWHADDDRSDLIADALAARIPQYADRPFERVLVFDLVATTGWAATDLRS